MRISDWSSDVCSSDLISNRTIHRLLRAQASCEEGRADNLRVVIKHIRQWPSAQTSHSLPKAVRRGQRCEAASKHAVHAVYRHDDFTYPDGAARFALQHPCLRGAKAVGMFGDNAQLDVTKVAQAGSQGSWPE